MNGLGDTVDGAGDRDRTGMASLEGSVTPAINALVRALLRWTSCLPRALRAIQWTNCSTGVAGPTVHCTPIAPADEEGASICLPARWACSPVLLAGSVAEGECGSCGAAIQSDAANFIGHAFACGRKSAFCSPTYPSPSEREPSCSKVCETKSRRRRFSSIKSLPSRRRLGECATT